MRRLSFISMRKEDARVREDEEQQVGSIYENGQWEKLN